MKNLVYYITIVPVYLLSVLPLPLLYLHSTLLYPVIYYLLKYRRGVARKNLMNAFPDKSKEELVKIEKAYYKHLCDLVVENIWAINASSSSLMKRCKFVNIEVVNNYYEKNTDFVFLLGHTGNWEWSNLSFSNYGLHQLWALYRPLSNKKYDRFFLNYRSRFGARLIPMQNVARAVMDNHHKCFGLAFIADQSPVPEYAYWTSFLNQETGFFNGYDKIARKKNLPVLFAHFTKVKRGYYEIKFEIITDNAGQLKPDELTETFARKLEQLIQSEPEHWLWSHRRWKWKKSDVVK